MPKAETRDKPAGAREGGISREGSRPGRLSPRRATAERVAPAELSPRRHRSLVHLLERRASDRGEREFLRFEGASITFGEAAERTRRLAAALVSLGLRPGDRVGIMLPNGLEFPLLWLAAARARAVVVPVNPGYGSSDLAHVLGGAGVRFVLAREESRAAVEEALDRLDDRGRRGSLERALAPGELEASAAEGGDVAVRPPDPDTVVTIQYTSGTMGLPKGCTLTHGYWLRLAATVARYGGFSAADVALTAQPFHYMDPTWNLALCLIEGIPLVILPRFSASTFWRSVRDSGATFFYCIGTMPVYLDTRPEEPEVERGHRVRLVLCSGIPPGRHAAFERRWRCAWRETYGTTELGLVLLVPPGDAASTGTGAMGAPVIGREVRLADETGRRPPAGRPGELLVRGPDTMLGYWDDPAATRRWRLDGWARTGDLVVEMEGGRYRMVGRRKEVIRRAGENISAVEVEAVLGEHPHVRAAACVPVPDRERGEEVEAFVELRPGVSPEEVPLEELAAFASRRLASFKVPRYWAYVDEFPLTPSHKIAKAKLTEGADDPRAGSWDRVRGEWR